MLDTRGYVKLCDFGLSKELHGPTLTVCGTPVYLAPEVLRGKGYTAAVDWWALGVLLYEVAVGCTPFEAESHFAVVQRIMARPRVIAYPPCIEAHAAGRTRDLVSQLLVGVPSKRLGGGGGDAAEVRSHPFFEGVDWDGLVRREVCSPWPEQIVRRCSDAVPFEAGKEGEPEPVWLDARPCDADSLAEFPGWEPLV